MPQPRVVDKLRIIRKNAGLYGVFEFLIKERFWLLLSKILGNRYRGKLYTLRTRFSSVPIVLRVGTTDRGAFHQVFIREQYDWFDTAFEPEFIIDAGANVGLASVYFFSRYPKARVAAIEPDPGNFEMLTRNTARFGDRILRVNSGLWPECTGLKVVRKDLREWAFQVRPVAPGETADFEAVDIETIMSRAQFPRIDLLKIDIERAEFELFKHRPLPWLDRVRVIAIELHDAECEKVFREALQGRKYTSKVSSETMVVTFHDLCVLSFPPK